MKILVLKKEVNTWMLTI